MNIPIKEESEEYMADIESFVRDGKLRHTIKFLTLDELAVKEMRESVDFDDELRERIFDED
jgi:hypothetical protein